MKSYPFTALFDDATVERFTCGDCAKLAIAVAGILNCSVVNIDNSHAAAYDELRGIAIDIEGVWDLDALVKRWGTTSPHVDVMTVKQARQEMRSWEGFNSRDPWVRKTGTIKGNACKIAEVTRAWAGF